MTDVRFYHLTTTALEQALPKMLEKVLEREQRAVVLAANEKRLDELDKHLWSYRPEAFLPHGTKRDGEREEQPIWLTTDPAEAQGTEVLFCVQGAVPALGEGDQTGLCAILFDGQDPFAVQAAREQWKALKAAGHELTYWQQTDRGGWDKKA